MSVEKTNGEKDEVESSYAKDNFHYSKEDGIAKLDLKWVVNAHRYKFIWDLPELDMDKVCEGFNNDLLNFYDRYFRHQNPKDHNKPINQILMDLREGLRRTLQDTDKYSEALEVGMFVFHHHARELKAGAGTYHPSSALWDFSLPWGAGIRGRAMRRGIPEFYAGSKNTSNIYRKPPDCPADYFLLAVPLPIPLSRTLISTNTPTGFYRIVMCLSSCSRTSGLAQLQNVEILKKTCDTMNVMWMNFCKNL